MKDLMGQNVLRFRHPCEVPPALLRRFLRPLFAGKCVCAPTSCTHLLLVWCDLHLVSPVHCSDAGWIHSPSKE